MSNTQTLVNTVIIPMSGYGTRMLPIGKAIEKSMLPIWNRPVLDYVLDEVEAAGITRVILTINSDARTVQQYFGTASSLEKFLKLKGKDDLLRLVQGTRRNFEFQYVINDGLDRYGTANVVWNAIQAVPDLPNHFAIIMGDNFCYRADGGGDLSDLLQDMQANGYNNGLLGAPVPDEKVHMYGIFETDSDSCLTNIAEKPQPDEVTSRLANPSRYVFSKADVYPIIKEYMSHPREGEYLLTDVVTELAHKTKVLVKPIKGEYLDAGTPEELYNCWQRLAPNREGKA